MDDRTPVIVDCDLYTAFGPGVETIIVTGSVG